MAYFPEQIMIDVQKADIQADEDMESLVPTNPILAEDYYVLADEIIAIENFLGVNQATQNDQGNLLNLNPATQNVLSMVRQLVAGLNALTSNGVLTSSGYANEQQRIIFPEDAWATFLASPPAFSDTSISVLSTSGFPQSGTISILNDCNVSLGTTVEWITYSGLTPTQFLNCKRGALGTTVGTHGGAYLMVPTGPNPDNSNLEDQCSAAAYYPPLAVALGPNKLCEYRYPSWRFKYEYSISELGLSGSLVDIAAQIMANPGISLPSDLVAAAASNGVLSYDNSGTPILSPSATWTQAYAFASEVAYVQAGPGDWIVGGSPLVPVFAGMLSISYSVNAITA